MGDADPLLAGGQAGTRPFDQTGRFSTLKHETCVLIAGPTGDLEGGQVTLGQSCDPSGLWLDDTRMLSTLVLTLGGGRLVPLAASGDEAGVVQTIVATNAPLTDAGGAMMAGHCLTVRRRRVLTAHGWVETVAITHHGVEPVVLPITWSWAADFRDLFEVRGKARAQQGTVGPFRIQGASVHHRYGGLDDVDRITSLTFHPTPVRISDGSAEQEVALAPGRTARIRLAVTVHRHRGPPVSVDTPLSVADLRRSVTATVRTRRDRIDRLMRMSVDHPDVDALLHQSARDLAMLTSDLPTGPYPAAGVPWFAVPFGRDGAITALFTLWADPTITHGVLRHLAATLATETDPDRDAEPGKARHEHRAGEMAQTGEVPFGAYHGGVDTTALFIWLAGEYVDRTGDYATAAALWPDLERAMGWIDQRRTRHADGLLTYHGSRSGGLKHQGWKDSFDAVAHADGTPAEGDIALVEVQGYVVAAKRAMADLAMILHREARGVHLLQEAETLSHRIEQHFWDDGLGTFAMAIDGAGAPCRVASSNPCHLLTARAITPARAQAVIARAGRSDLDAGSGVRSLSTQAARYAPLSYHNGSVWPHETGLFALGCAQYGQTDRAASLLAGLVSAAKHFPKTRLPELWSGHTVTEGSPLVPHPSACTPQAWSAASVFACVQATLGMRLDGAANTVTLNQPRLPPMIGRLSIDQLRVGHGMVSMTVWRDGDTTRACLDHATAGAKLILA